ALEVTEIKALSRDDAGITAQLPGELVGAHVKGVDLGDAALQQAVGEAARGRPGVEGDLSGDLEAEGVERPFELEPAPTDVAGAILDLDGEVLLDFLAGLERTAEPLDAHFPGEDEPLGRFPGITESAPEEELIESFFGHAVWELAAPAREPGSPSVQHLDLDVAEGDHVVVILQA